MRRFLLACLLLPLGAAAPLAAQTPAGFYDLATIQDIRLTFTQPNWDYQLDTAKAGSEGYILAVQCVINGVTFDSVGVKYKGNSSYNAARAKNPLHIELNHVRGGQTYGPYTDVKLSNIYADPAMVREVLAYDILRNYMDAPRANFARVTVNGAAYGLMTNVENVGSRFLTDHFYSAGHPFVKCTPPGGVRPGTTAASDLRYLGATPSAYAASYELKPTGATAWGALVHLCDTLNNHPAELPTVLDVDRAAWMLAFNNVLVNLDSYSGAFRQNYYLYQDDDRRFCPISWDLNMAFGSFSMLTAGGGGPGGRLDTTGMKNLSPGANASSSSHPLIQKIWATPRYKRLYLAHLRTLVDELTGPARQVQAQQLQALIRPDVVADTHKFYSLAQFDAGLTAFTSGGGMGGPGGGIPGVLRLLTGRLNFLRTQADVAAVPPTLAATAPTLTPAAPHLNDTVWVTAPVTGTGAAAPTAVLLGFRYDHARKFRQTPMLDDGRHHDGAANDGTFGAALPAQALLIEYYLYAENATAGICSPRRAEHEFHQLAVGIQLPPPGAVVLNELLADNVAADTTAAGQHDDWAELFNTTAAPINLTGLYLTDDPALLNKWAFPANTVIGANGYLTVWADNGTAIQDGALHTNFKLSKAGEFLILSDGAITRFDSVGFGAQVSDSTWGRLPNGTGPWRRLPPTFAAENTLTPPLAAPADAPVAALMLWPNPADGRVSITGALGELTIYNALGQVVRRARAANGPTVIRTADLAAGLYWVRAANGAARRLVVTHTE